MTRTVISIEPDLYQRARAHAETVGMSFAEFVRSLLQEKLGDTKAKVDPSIIFNLGTSKEPTDIARDKDRLIGEAVWADYLRKTGRANEP